MPTTPVSFFDRLLVTSTMDELGARLANLRARDPLVARALEDLDSSPYLRRHVLIGRRLEYWEINPDAPAKLISTRSFFSKRQARAEFEEEHFISRNPTPICHFEIDLKKPHLTHVLRTALPETTISLLELWLDALLGMHAEPPAHVLAIPLPVANHPARKIIQALTSRFCHLVERDQVLVIAPLPVATVVRSYLPWVLHAQIFDFGASLPGDDLATLELVAGLLDRQHNLRADCDCSTCTRDLLHAARGLLRASQAAASSSIETPATR